MKIRNARLQHTDGLHDLTVADGRFTSITPTADGEAPAPAEQAAPADGEEVLDADGALLVPQLVDSHLHLDYANTVGQPRVNESGTLFEAIDIWAEHKEQGYNNHDTILANAMAALRSEVAHGVGFIRTHVDVTDPDLTALHALVELREQVREWCEVQIIAFPQNGILAYPDGPELMDRAMREGADVVGGIPHFERSHDRGVESLELIFDLAEKYGKAIDVHCDEIDDDQSRFLEVMAQLAVERGMEGRVTASHVVASSYYGPGYLAKLIPKLVQADMRFAVNPTENLHLQGWGVAQPIPRGVAPVRQYTEAGLNVAFGQDSIADPWYPIGEGALLRILDSALHVGHMLNEEYMRRCLDFITVNGARNMGLEDEYGIAEGKPASFILLDALNDKDALWHQGDVLASVHNGKVVLTQPKRAVSWRV